METVSEQLFRVFCRNAGWFAWRVRTQDTKALRRPDFVVWRRFRRLAVEVKQVDPNPADDEQAGILDAGGMASFGGEPGARLRDHIKDASAQLKSLTRGRWPGVVVLYDNTALRAYTGSYHIKIAMHGLEQIMLERTGLETPMTRFVGYRFGPKRRVTPTDGTAVSAVCHLYCGTDGEPCLDVFHNEHTSSHLDNLAWRAPRLRHFRLGPGADRQRRDWIAVHSAS